jgi:hypothetical protein
MVSGARPQVDFGQEGFIASFDFDPVVVARIKEIQRRRWNSEKAAWIVEPHWPSVQRLLFIASELGWTITAQARAAEQRVRQESDDLEYSVDVVHDSHGSAWFQCTLGDDDLLLRQVKAIPGAFWDDKWWIPTDWEPCCGPLLEIVQSDMRLEVSNAAWQLLEEEDVSHRFVRSSAPQLTTHEDTCIEPEDSVTQSVGVGRKPRVTTRNTRIAPTPAKRDAG